MKREFQETALEEFAKLFVTNKKLGDFVSLTKRYEKESLSREDFDASGAFVQIRKDISGIQEIINDKVTSCANVLALDIDIVYERVASLISSNGKVQVRYAERIQSFIVEGEFPVIQKFLHSITSKKSTEWGVNKITRDGELKVLIEIGTYHLKKVEFIKSELAFILEQNGFEVTVI